MKDKLVIVVVVLALLLGAYGAFRSAPTQVVERVIQEKQLGALAGPDIPYPYLSFGDVRQWAAGVPLATGAVTLCAIQSPAATTTLQSATLRIDSHAAYANTFEIGYGNTSGATTTRLAIRTIAASVPGELISTTTLSTITASDNIIKPSTYINFKVASGTISSVFAPAGKCSVVFREI